MSLNDSMGNERGAVKDAHYFFKQDSKKNSFEILILTFYFLC